MLDIADLNHIGLGMCIQYVVHIHMYTVLVHVHETVQLHLNSCYKERFHMSNWCPPTAKCLSMPLYNIYMYCVD